MERIPTFSTKAIETALQVAVGHGFMDTARELVGADPNAMNFDGETPLHLACRNALFPMIKWLIQEAGANPRVQCKTPLLLCAFYGKMMPKALIELGMDPSQEDEMGRTVAHVLVSVEYDEERSHDEHGHRIVKGKSQEERFRERF